MAQKPQKNAADAAAKLIAKYGKAAVSSAVRNFKPAKAVKITPIKGTGNARQYPKSNVKPRKPLTGGISDRGTPGERFTREQMRIKSLKKK
jgi:hypothetical protein